MGTIHAVLVGVGDYAGRRAAGSSTRDLLGAEDDLRGWASRLKAMGLSRATTTILCSPSGAGCPDWADGPATRGQLLDEITRLADHLAADPSSRGLLIVSAHGGDGALLQASDGPVSEQEVVDILRQRVPERGITAILDLCTPTQPSTPLPRLRAKDLVLLAADQHHPAEEHQDQGTWHGAFTWALHQVLDRWMATGPHGHLVPISPQVLVTQARQVLAGLGYGQRPCIRGPRHARANGLLGSASHLAAPLAPVLTRQVDPEWSDHFKIYDLLDASGSPLNQILVVTGPQWTPPQGSSWKAGREYWSGGFPTVSFQAVPTGAGLPGSVPTTAYQHIAFDPSQGTTSTTLTTPLFSVKHGGSVVGYVRPGANRMEWYRAATVTAYYPTGTLVFTKLSSGVTASLQQKVAQKT